MTADETRAFQMELLALIRRYHTQGAAYDDLAKCVLNIASIVALTANITISDGIALFEFLYKLAEDEHTPSVKN